MKHKLAQDLNTGLTKSLEETGAGYHEWYELAMRARMEAAKLIDRSHDSNDAEHRQIMEELAEHGVQFYNAVVGTFLTAGLREEGKQFQKTHRRAVQIVREALPDAKKND